MRPDGIDMRRPGIDQRDLAAGGGEPRADAGAERPGTDDHDPQWYGSSLTSMAADRAPRAARIARATAAVERPAAG